MIDAYFTTIVSGWWVFGYVITLGTMLGMYEPDKTDSKVARFFVALLAWTITYFVYPLFWGMLIARLVK